MPPLEPIIPIDSVGYRLHEFSIGSFKDSDGQPFLLAVISTKADHREPCPVGAIERPSGLRDTEQLLSGANMDAHQVESEVVQGLGITFRLACNEGLGIGRENGRVLELPLVQSFTGGR